MNLDQEIDHLYQLPLAEFTAARNALAKTLKGDDAKRVRALTKPPVIPWAVNQLFWRDRPTFDRLMKAGETLREAQIATLKGRTENIPKATEHHKKTLSEAVREAGRIATGDAVQVDAEALAKLLSALSLSPKRSDHPGRMTELVQPAGFEALAGVHPLAAKTKTPLLFPNPPARDHGTVSPQEAQRARKREEEAKRKREKEDAAHQAALNKARREMEKKVRSAEQALERVLAEETRTSAALDRLREERRGAERQLMTLRTQLREM